MLAVSIFSIIKWGFKLSEDFVGGATYIIKLPHQIDSNKIKKVFEDNQITLRSISRVADSFTIKFLDISQDKKLRLEDDLKTLDNGFQIMSFETVGPSLGKELIQKTIVAIILSAISLLIFIGTRFKDFTFGFGAIVAMFHDALILIGVFSLLGHLMGAEMDALFVTALLTTLSASVHDTVVTFDRIRELKRQNFKVNWVELSNQAVSETIVRSINNSMTVVFMLLSLVILGGSTTRWFATALLVGVVCGTYSSTGVAIPIMLFWKRKK